jgi:Zn-dependent protease with chaperone function
VTAPLLLIPLAVEWVILLTTLTPILLVNKFVTRPRLGIAIWFVAFIAAGAALILALFIAIWGYADTVNALSQEEFGGEDWGIALAISFAPWIALAIGGVSLALINQKLEPLALAAREVKPLLHQSKAPLMNFMGVSVATVELPFAYAFATNREILISKFAVENLTQKELEAVLWHELCHVKQKHFVIKRLSRLIRELSPALAASGVLVSEVEKLTELAADSFALQHVDRATLFRARQLFAAV